MSYEIRLSDTAKESLDLLNKKTAERISRKLEGIRDDPYRFVKRLKGMPLFSLRAGDYRIIMDIKNNQMLIFVVRIGHRSKAYNKL
jgi:mRNA interferase RelE/StbE